MTLSLGFDAIQEKSAKDNNSLLTNRLSIATGIELDSVRFRIG
jgi:hypothetical protein